MNIDDIVAALRQAQAALERDGDDTRTADGVCVASGIEQAKQAQAAAVEFGELIDQLAGLASEMRATSNLSGAHAEHYNNLEQHLRSAGHAAHQLTGVPAS